MMKGFYSIFFGSLLVSFIALIIALLPSWLKSEEKLTKSSLVKIASAIAVIFLITFLWSYTQYSEPPLPSGIDNESTNIKAAWNNAGVAFYRQGNYTSAINCYNKAIEMDPEYVLAWSNKGNALKALHRSDEADKALARARNGI